jgi:hypothetical protein
MSDSRLVGVVLRHVNVNMPVIFATYLTQLAEAVQSQNGPNLAYLLRPTSPHGKDFVKEFRNPTVRMHAFPASNTAPYAGTSEKVYRSTKEAWRAPGMRLPSSTC